MDLFVARVRWACPMWQTKRRRSVRSARHRAGEVTRNVSAEVCRQRAGNLGGLAGHGQSVCHKWARQNVGNGRAYAIDLHSSDRFAVFQKSCGATWLSQPLPNVAEPLSKLTGRVQIMCKIGQAYDRQLVNCLSTLTRGLSKLAGNGQPFCRSSVKLYKCFSQRLPKWTCILSK